MNDVEKWSAYAPGMDELTIEGEIAKVDPDKRQVFGWASVTELNGEPVVDLQNDVMETYELEKAAYDYVLHSRVGGEMHQRVVKDAPKQVGTLIESMVLTPEKIEKMGLPAETPRGWWIGFKVNNDEVWKSVKDGKYSGFSIHGLGKRIEKNLDEINKRVIERSEQEIKGWVERIAKTIGIEPEQLAQDLVAWMSEEGVDDPTDDQLHEFIMETYGSGEMTVKEPTGSPEVEKMSGVEASRRFLLAKAAQRARTHQEFVDNVEEIGKAISVIDEDSGRFFDEVHKHLIGNHEQDDHDPTKKKKRFGHKRSEHAPNAQKGAGIGAGAGVALGALQGAKLGPAGAAVGALTGATGGATMGYQFGGGQFFGSPGGSRLGGLAAGMGNVAIDPISTAGRRLIYGNPNVAQEERSRRSKRKLSKRQMEVLEKYLGPLEPVSKKIERRGDSYVVLSESGKVLGTHDSKEEAARQLSAVEANKDH